MFFFRDNEGWALNYLIWADMNVRGEGKQNVVGTGIFVCGEAQTMELSKLLLLLLLLLLLFGRFSFSIFFEIEKIL